MALDDAYTSQVAPRSAFLQAPPGDSAALRAWAHAVSSGALSTEGLRFAAWVRMAPTTHTLRMHEFACAWCPAPYFGWGDHMSRDCVVVVAAALGGFRAMARALVREGYGMHRTETMGSYVYGRHGAVARWCVVQGKDIPIMTEWVVGSVGCGSYLAGATVGLGLMHPNHRPPCGAGGRLSMRGGVVDLRSLGGAMGSIAPPRWPVLAHGCGAVAG